ncbi:hypothetical protein POPTR_017G090200v4 [Populus trichocarpa]|jgi:hypothetical protein|uniref:Uncharacterized protein n=2 Tax=Populus trichocarpa TaxID=3694 RepID=A0ACC0RR27_POPTR|nr:uncharacterized protein LOC7484559 [Populus trichocarpa]XP_024444195.2 uncharacterized protein LOC7484559 [Populus trichocarpa]KAI9379396.1 hypothetical protein POPTR_017G090200v4 [Populus trichocarpa]KAI9379397.1 hypothetical protein POPTR_017G090200v4 [Populus trichocarpa]
MAEPSISLAVTPTIAEADRGNSKRNSMGKSSSSDTSKEILPHYLRASTGSCHDFCKYGRKHAFEEKARCSFPRRIIKKLPDDQSLAESQTEDYSTSVVKVKSSPNSKSPSANSPEIIKREVSTKSVVSQTPLFKEVLTKRMTPAGLLARSFDSQSSMLREALAKKESSAGSPLTKSFDGRSPVSREVLAKKKSSAGSPLTKSFDGRSPVSSEVLFKKMTLTQEVSTKSADSQGSGPSEIWMRKKTSAVRRKENSKINSSTKLDGGQGSGSSEIWMKTKTTAVGRKKDSEVNSYPSITRQDLASSSEKPGVSMKQVLSKAKEVKLSAKYASTLNPKSSSPDASRVFGARRNGDIKIKRRTGTSKPVAKNLQASPRASFSPRRSVSGVARGLASPRASLSSKPSPIRIACLNEKKNRSLKLTPQTKEINDKQHKNKNSHKNADPVQPDGKLEESNGDTIQEKTLYVIKVKADNKYVESDHNENVSVEASPPLLSSLKSPSLPKSISSMSHSEKDEEESEYTVTEAEDDTSSEYDETECIEETETLEAEHRGRNRKSGMVLSEDKDGNPVKLRFRRGRVIDILSENNSPRRLKFRRGRVLGDNQNLKADGRRSFKRRGADGDVIDSKHDSGKFVLRHQDVHGKKDAQGLFNNVIEETASKLVETRKSKVKALVGAFETVISLQDGKPSANAAS